jgi:hypothetical protein
MVCTELGLVARENQRTGILMTVPDGTNSDISESFYSLLGRDARAGGVAGPETIVTKAIETVDNDCAFGLLVVPDCNTS